MKKQTLSDKINIYGYNDNKTPDEDVLAVKYVKESLKRVLKKIKNLPNRDDKISSRIKKLDGGGVGRFKVLKIMKEEFGEELLNSQDKTESEVKES